MAHLIGVPLGDSSLNPARSIGPALLEGGTALGNLWVFIVAPIVGALVGYGLYRLRVDCFRSGHFLRVTAVDERSLRMREDARAVTFL